MLKRLAKKIAQKHMEIRYPQQPLRLQPDYGERNAADFLGENVVQVNMGIEPLRGGPGNVKDEVIADDFEADFLSDDFEAEELEGFEIVDDIGLDRMSDFWKESRFHSGPKGKKEFEQWKKDNPDAAETFDEQTEINKDVVKNRAKAMSSEDFQELDSEQKELEEKLEDIKEDKEEIVEDAGKTAHYEIIDDLGLGRIAGDLSDREISSSLKKRLVNSVSHIDRLLSKITLDDLSDAVEDMNAVESALIKSQNSWGELFVDVDGHPLFAPYHEEVSGAFESFQEAIKEANHEITSMIDRGLADEGNERYVYRVMENEVLPTLEYALKNIEDLIGSVPKGSSRMAKDHEESGSYMSRQNLREISDMADFIVDDIGMDDLDDWVEDKISHAHSAMNDVARYRGYRDDHPHGEEEGYTFKFADDIIDDMGITADFDKESRVKSHKHNSAKEVKDSYEAQKKNFGKEWAKYEGAMTSKGIDPARVQKNTGGSGGGLSALDSLGPAKKPSSGGLDALSRLAHHDDIIDDLEW